MNKLKRRIRNSHLRRQVDDDDEVDIFLFAKAIRNNDEYEVRPLLESGTNC